MSGKADFEPNAVPDLDDLLQCPVCYEIPSGQIFQCNEGHHVCGPCKARLDVCPVCRALFFGTRNYAMEELIANMRKLRAFKLGGKVTTGSVPGESSSTPAREVVTEEPDNTAANNEDPQPSDRPTATAPPACRGLFRCLCCKNGNAERLPSARLLNHLRYYHPSELIEGQSENGEYIQAWQFSTDPGKITTAVRVSNMGIFFLVIEITLDSVCAWLRIAASQYIANEFSYTITLSGNDREAIFSDAVWSSKACEGSLKRRGHCLSVEGLDARALIATATISSKLTIRRLQMGLLAQQPQPRAVLRVASRGTARNTTHDSHAAASNDLEPFLQDLQNDVARLTRAFATLGREANALIRSEAEIRGMIENTQNREDPAPGNNGSSGTAQANPASDDQEPTEPVRLSRSARRRMRQRLLAALNEPQLQFEQSPRTQQQNSAEPPIQNGSVPDNQVILLSGLSVIHHNPVAPSPTNPQIASGPSNNRQHENGHNVRVNKKNRRHRR